MALSTHLYLETQHKGRQVDRCTSKWLGKPQLPWGFHRVWCMELRRALVWEKESLFFNRLHRSSKNAVKDALFLQICKGNGMERTQEEISGQYLHSKRSFLPFSFVRSLKPSIMLSPVSSKQRELRGGYASAASVTVPL